MVDGGGGDDGSIAKINQDNDRGCIGLFSQSIDPPDWIKSGSEKEAVKEERNSEHLCKSFPKVRSKLIFSQMNSAVMMRNMMGR